jgi:Spy/CpxP family protein refolding chaperone
MDAMNWQRRGTLLALIIVPYVVSAAGESPYSGEEQRRVASLSEKEIESLMRGDGMGFAKLAELNHFPGPKHVLDLSEQLGLSTSQVDATRQLYEEMRRNAVKCGEQLVQAESRLDEAFKDGSVSAASLEAALLDIEKIRAHLRYIHLESHLRQTAILTTEQVARYDELRGYRRHAARAHH